jgi:protein-tyrosine phosphatase
MKKILFVCHGNICRSPMAEFVMKDLVKKAGRSGEFRIASAAVSREEIGNPVYPPARRELQKHGIRCDGHAAHQITRAELDEYDKIYYMDSSNARYLRRLFGDAAVKCQPLLDRDVADPWYTGDFSATWADILEGCERILEETVC